MGVILFVHHSTDHYFALFSKLDRISRKIDQDLAQPPGIAFYKGRNLIINHAGKFKILLVGRYCQHINSIFKGCPQVKVQDLKFQFFGLYLGKIKDVIYYFHKAVAAVANDFGIFPLIGSQFGV